jgi:hypothetical protein
MRKPSREGDVYVDPKTNNRYFRDNNNNVYCLDANDFEMYFCCSTKISELKDLTEEQKRFKRRL